MDLPKHVELIEVCPRDGFQNVHDIIPFEGKVAIIKKLAEAGFKRLEIVSFVSPKAIPQMADAKDVVAAVKDTLAAPDEVDRHRRGLQLRLEILQHGSLSLVSEHSTKEVTYA